MKSKILGIIFGGIIKLFDMTYRYRYLDGLSLKKAAYKLPKPQYIVAVWHNNIIGVILSGAWVPHITIISASKDGDILASAGKMLKLIAARGSSHRGGASAKKRMMELLDTGSPSAISVDGPTGPIYDVKNGIIEMAQVKGLPIIPYASLPDKAWVIEKAWDKFRIPKPFSKIYFKICDPIWVPADLPREDYAIYQQKIREELLKGEEELKRRYL